MLSTAERQEIMADPNVREVMDLFGGDLIDIIKDPTMPAVNQANDEEEIPQDES